MATSITNQSATPAAMDRQSPSTQVSDHTLTAWRDAHDEASGRVAVPPPVIAGSSGGTAPGTTPDSARTGKGPMLLSQGGSGGVPAIKLNPELRAIAGPPGDAEGHFTNNSAKAAYPFASEDRLAHAFAAQFNVPGMQVGILGETHTGDAHDILLKTAVATKAAVAQSGREVFVAVETPTNKTVDAALDKLNAGHMSSDEFVKVASKSLAGDSSLEDGLRRVVIAGHDAHLKYVFWDKNRQLQGGQIRVTDNRDKGGAQFLAQEVKAHPNAVFVVEAGFSHAQVNTDLIQTEPEAGITPGITLAHLLVNQLGRQHVFSVQESPVGIRSGAADGKVHVALRFPNLIEGYRRDSPVKVPGVGSEGQLTGAKFPTYDAIVPVIIPHDRP